jgi:hypothetical protein
MREFNVQDRITLSAKLSAGAMSVAAEPRNTAAVEVLPYDDSSASREAAEQTKVELRGATLVVESPERGWRLRRSGQVRVDVRLPEDSRLVVRVASADARCTGRYGDSTIDSGSGDVTVDQVAGSLTVRTASAGVRVDRVAGLASVSTASGNVLVGYAEGDVIAASSSGDVTVDRADGSVRAKTASGDVRLGSVGAGTVEVNTASGDVRVGIAAGTSVWLDLSTASGRTRSELDHRDGPSPTDGAAQLTLQVRTASGDIELRRVPAPTSA